MREMNDSGVEWIGEIPTEWEAIKLKYLFADGNDGLKIGPFGSVIRGKTLDNGPYKIYNQAHLIQNDFNLNRHFVTKDTFQELSNYRVKPGDILFSMMGTIGKCRIMPSGYPDGIIDSHLLKTGLNERIIPEFFVYAYDKDYSNQVINQLLYSSNGTIMNGLNSSILKSVFIALPPIEIQRRIIDYLDSKCSKIDEIIEKQQQIIEKLKEYKLSVITEAVTKGLNPDVEMKDSGVEWLGNVPTHWDIKKLGLCANIQTGPFGSQLHADDYVDQGTPIITVEHFGDMIINHVNLPLVSDQDKERLNKYILDKGDLVFSRVGSVDRCVIVSEKEDGWLFSGRCLRVRLNEDSKINPSFVNYLFANPRFREMMLLVAVGATMPSINTTILSNIKIVVPPIAEQNTIIELLKDKCEKINNAILNKQQIVNKLSEYKKSLIYEVVTGKKEV